MKDNYVTAYYYDALKLYKIKCKSQEAYHFLEIPIKKDTHSYIVMIKDFEEYYLKDKKNAHVKKLQDKRLKLRNRYIQIRGELIELLNKVHDTNVDFIVLTDYAKIIKKYSKTNMSVIDASNSIYYIIKDDLIKNISIAKRKKTLNNALYNTFSVKEYYHLITTKKYLNLINTLKTNEEMLAFVSVPENLQIFKSVNKKKFINDIIITYTEKYKIGPKCKKIIKNYANDSITLECAINQINDLVEIEKRTEKVSDLAYWIPDDRYSQLMEGLCYEEQLEKFKNLLRNLQCAQDYIHCKDINLIDIRKLKRNARIELSSKLVPEIKKMLIRKYFSEHNIKDDFEKYINDDQIIKKFINETDYKEYFKELKYVDPNDYDDNYVIKNCELYCKNEYLPAYIEDHLYLLNSDNS